MNMNQFIVIVPRGNEFSCFFTEAIPLKGDSLEDTIHQFDCLIASYLHKRNEAEISHDYEGLYEERFIELKGSHFDLECFIRSSKKAERKDEFKHWLNSDESPYNAVSPIIVPLSDWLISQSLINKSSTV